MFKTKVIFEPSLFNQNQIYHFVFTLIMKKLYRSACVFATLSFLYFPSLSSQAPVFMIMPISRVNKWYHFQRTGEKKGIMFSVHIFLHTFSNYIVL